MTIALNVIRATVSHAGLAAEGGQIVAVPLMEQQLCFVVVLAGPEGQRLLSAHATEAEAIAQAERVEAEFARAGLLDTPGKRAQ